MDSIQGARMKLVRMQGNWTRTLGIAGFASVLAILAPSVATAADTDSGAIAYGEQVVGPQKHATGLTALGPDLFGEEINTFTGGIAFSQTDLSLPGNDGLPVNVTRRLVVDGNKSPSFNTDKSISLWRGYPFGEWEFDLPYLGGTYTENDGWVVDTSTPTARCSSPTSYRQFRPRDVLIDGYVNFSSYTFWNGIQLNVPGAGEQQVLYRPADSALPMPAGTWTALTTKSQWHFACLPTLKSGQAGEGFLALAPDGTRYWFDWMVSHADRPMHGYGTQISQTGQTFRMSADVNRRTYRLYPTRVEDRFGNYVTYSYATTSSEALKLTQISASDGRSITFGYNLAGQIISATAGTQTVQYGYANGLLSTVTLPDGSHWGYSTAAVVDDLDRFVLLSDATPFDDAFSCQRMRRLTGDQADLVMTHPSGAQGVFHLGYNRLYRTDLQYSLVDCGTYNNPDGVHPSWRDEQPNRPLRFDVLALQSKTLSGPGVTAQTWQYQHQDTYQIRDGLGGGDPINGTRTMTTVRPDGSKDVSVFGTDALINEGQLLSQEVRNTAGTALSRRVNTYVQTSEMPTAPFADWMGEPLGYVAIRGPEDYNRPLKQSVLQQQGVSFTWQVPAACFGTNTLCFDQLVRPVRTVRSSTLGYSKTEATTYADNTVKWVLGQVAKTTCITSTPANAGCDNGTDSVESETTFDPTYAVPLTTKVFNKVQKTLGYDLTSAVATGQRGTLKTVKDGNNNITTVTNWKRGVPQTITYPATPDQPTPVQESAAVDDNGWITAVTDETGARTCYGYDAMGRVNRITYPSETQLGVCDTSTWAATSITYGNNTAAAYGMPAGHWRQTTQTGNGRKILILDAFWRPVVEQTLDLGNVAGTTSEVIKRYDESGKLAFQSYPMNTGGQAVYSDATLKGIHTSYDALGRVVETDQDAETPAPLKTLTAYLNEFKTQVTNPRGYRTITGFMAFDQPTTDWPVDIDAADGTAEEADTDIKRDIFGKPLAITRHNPAGTVTETRSYVYNTVQELCKTIEPETGATVSVLDGAGNLSWSASGLALPNTANCDVQYVPDGTKVARSYDARNRVLSVVFPDHRGDTTSHYTADGLVASITADNGGTDQVTTSYVYNQRRLLTRETLAWAAINWPVSYAYDANGHLASQSWHGVSATYLPNALGQPTQVGSYATGVSYYPNGALKQFTYGNGIVHTLTQNARQLPDTSTDAYGATKIISDSYDYDANGNVQAITDGATGRAQRGNRDMTYDALDRLKTAASPMFGNGTTGTASYSYDALDNLTRVTMPATTTMPGRDWFYCYDAAWRLTNLKTGSCTGATVTGLGYDERGNVANKNGQTFDFDEGNRLRGVFNGATATSSYVYDGLGRRVRDYTTASKYSQYTQSGQLAMTADERSNKVDEYFYLAGSLVAIRERDVPTGVYTVKYQHTDALGSPVAVTDAGRTVIERSEYEPYGKVLTDSPHDGPGYTGHVLDVATGLNYMQQRYYDPQIGRFLSVDPVTADGGGGNFNRYWYGSSNPYKFVDPDGRQVCLPFGHITGGFGDCTVSPKGGGSHLFRGCQVILCLDTAGGAETHADGCDTSECDEVKATNAGIVRKAGETYVEAGKMAAKEAGWWALGEFGGNKLKAFVGKVGRLLGLVSEVSFGRNINQLNHTFRHVEAAGLERATVQKAVLSDLKKNATQIPAGKPYNGTISVSGVDVTYTAFRLGDGTINVGRITTP